ncbi:hypothetical protein [Mesorhizobium salmacidum]|uniref:hypothetical protein n=1 Tax=Mesorhizobium salmacidum TaxID=3015171 RepID=UPI0039F4DA60
MRIETGGAPPALWPRRSLADFRRPIRWIAADIATPDRAAACRADVPSSLPSNTGDRRSSLSVLAIIHLIQVDVETAQQSCVTSQ